MKFSKIKPIRRINEEQVKDFPSPFTCFLTQTLKHRDYIRKIFRFFRAA